MKKQLVKFTLLLLVIALGVSNAFAEDVYKKGKEDWTANDVTDWKATNFLANKGLVLDGVGNISASHNFSFKTQDPLVTLVADFKTGNACANADSYDYFTFGGLTFKFNKVGKTNPSGYFKLVADGEEKTFDRTPESKVYTITIVVDQVEDKASYTLDYKGDVIASGIVNTTTELKTVKFGHYTTNQTDDNTLTLQSLEIKENPGVELTLNNYMYSTFCSDWNVDFSRVNDVEAYTAKVSGNVVSLERVNGLVMAGEGLLIKKVGNVPSVTLPVVHDATKYKNNALVGVTKNMKASDFRNKTAYILVSDTEFKYIDPDKSEHTLQKGKAYLELPPETPAKPSTLFIGEATAINGIAVEKKADNAIYNLQGMRVKTPTKGLYIINGKKYRF